MTPLRRLIGRDWLPIVALAGVSVVLFADLFFGRNLYLRDTTRYYYSTKSVVAESFQEGALPLWDRYHGAGQPMAANPQYEVFYPGQWPIFLPSYDLGFKLHIVMHLPLAILGMFLFLRSLGLRRGASTFGAVAFALGGPMASSVSLLPCLFAHAWTPWILLFTIRVLRRPSLREIALCGLTIGMQTLVLIPSMSIGTTILVAAIILFHLTKRGRTPKQRAIAGAAIALAGAIGAAIASAVIFPTVDHVAGSARAGGLTKEMLDYWGFVPARLGELVVPHMLGYAPFDGGVYWGRVLLPEAYPFLQNIYSGILTPILLVTAIAAFWRERWARWTASVFALLFLMALGTAGPLMPLLQQFAPFDRLRYTEKYVIFILFVAVVVASIAFDRLGQNARLTRVSFVAACGVAILIAACGAWWVFGQGGATVVELAEFDPWALAVVQPAGTKALGGAMLRALVAVMLLAAWKSGNRRALHAALVFVVLDLGLFMVAMNPRMPDRFYLEEPEVTAEMSPDRDAYRMFHLAEWHHGSPIAHAHLADRTNVYWHTRNGLFPRVAATWGLRNVFDSDIDQTFLESARDLREAMWKVRERNPRYVEIFSAMSNVRYVAAYRPVEESIALARGDRTRVRPVAFVPMGDNPRYYFADEVVRISSIDEFVDELSTGTFSPRVAFVFADRIAPARGSVIAVDERANDIRIDVDVETEGLLVASVTHHKYWTARIDGLETPIHQVNVGYQGVVVPPGRHTVDLVYDNPVVITGMRVSSAGFAIAIALLVLTSRPLRSRASRS